MILSDGEVRAMSALALAHMGDAVRSSDLIHN